jgi:hypothetical protein
MKRFIIIQLLAVVFAAQIQAQGDGEIKYRRSSLYSMMINHEGREFGDEIKDVFLKIPVPDKYNNHDLSVKVIYTSEKKLDKNHEEIDEFIRNNGIASRMVGRWFNRDYMTGICDVELVKERGLYNQLTIIIHILSIISVYQFTSFLIADTTFRNRGNIIQCSIILMHRSTFLRFYQYLPVITIIPRDNFFFPFAPGAEGKIVQML